VAHNEDCQQAALHCVFLQLRPLLEGRWQGHLLAYHSAESSLALTFELRSAPPVADQLVESMRECLRQYQVLQEITEEKIEVDVSS
jgi:hypothetical protein